MNTVCTDIVKRLFALQDLSYKDFQSKLIPNLSPAAMIGVRTPELRRLAKELGAREDIGDFLSDLPHHWFDENQLHAFLISAVKDYSITITLLNEFLPYIDNWATCDQLSPRSFAAHRAELLPEVKAWLASKHPYTVRFGVGMLMQHYLDEDFDPQYLTWVAALHREEYYVNMMRAWYFATALAKQYDAVLPYLSEQRLDGWTHNKTIQKAVESYRLSAEQKQVLRAFRIPRKKEK